MNDTLDQAKLTPAQERVMEAARAHRSVYGLAVPNPEYPYQVILRSARALVAKGLLREVIPSHTGAAPEFTLDVPSSEHPLSGANAEPVDEAPKWTPGQVAEHFDVPPALYHHFTHAQAREQLSKQFRGVSLNIPRNHGRGAADRMAEVFEELKDASKRAHSLGFSHAAILTGKHTYAGTVPAKEKAARRRRNAAARVARRKNRKG